MKWNFKWGKNNKQEMTPELTERNVNVYQHDNPIRGAEHLSQRKCVECGKWFTPTYHNQTICSDECRKARAKQQYDKWHKRASEGKSPITYKGKCVICGNKFETIYKRQVTCSKECSAAYKQQKKKEWQREHYQELYDRYKRKKQVTVEPAKATNERKEDSVKTETIVRGGKPWTPPVKVCPVCGKQFVATSNRQVYCSDECAHKAYTGEKIIKTTPSGFKYVSTAPTRPIKCEICGKSFVPRTKRGKYCSEACRQEAARECSRKWDAAHRSSDAGVKLQRADVATEKPIVNKHLEAASVIRKLIEAGIDDEIVAKYLQTYYGSK